MTVIDAHVHIHREYLDSSQLIRDMDSCRVDKSVVFASPINPTLRRTVPFWYSRMVDRTWLGQTLARLLPKTYFFKNQPPPNNADVARAVAAYPNRLLMLHFASPHDDYAVTPFEDAVRSQRCIGLKLHLWVHPVSLFDPRLQPLFEMAERRRHVVLVDLGTRASALAEIDVLAERFRRIHFIVPHLPPIPALAATCASRPNLSLDTSGPQVTRKALLAAYRAVGPEKLIFGSDSPRSLAGDLEYSLDAVRSMPVTDREKEMILSRNMQALIDRVS